MAKWGLLTDEEDFERICVGAEVFWAEEALSIFKGRGVCTLEEAVGTLLRLAGVCLCSRLFLLAAPAVTVLINFSAFRFSEACCFLSLKRSALRSSTALLSSAIFLSHAVGGRRGAGWREDRRGGARRIPAAAWFCC